METETYLTGYCRQLDAPRTVEALLENGHLKEADCNYGPCPHTPTCQNAQELKQLEK